jgi:hypothetical protein
MNSLWKLVRLCMMSTSNVTWMQCCALALLQLFVLGLNAWGAQKRDWSSLFWDDSGEANNDIWADGNNVALHGFIFEGLTYAPIRDLIAVVGGLRSNRHQLSTLVPPIIWMEWHCAFAQFHTVKCWHKTNAMPCLGSIATFEMDRH